MMGNPFCIKLKADLMPAQSFCRKPLSQRLKEKKFFILIERNGRGKWNEKKLKIPDMSKQQQIVVKKMQKPCPDGERERERAEVSTKILFCFSFRDMPATPARKLKISFAFKFTCCGVFLLFESPGRREKGGERDIHVFCFFGCRRRKFTYLSECDK